MMFSLFSAPPKTKLIPHLRTGSSESPKTRKGNRDVLLFSFRDSNSFVPPRAIVFAASKGIRHVLSRDLCRRLVTPLEGSVSESRHRSLLCGNVSDDHPRRMRPIAFVLLHNVALPSVLISAFVLRVNLFSFVYVFFSLLVPFFLTPSNSRFKGCPKRFLTSICLYALLVLGSQLLYNVLVHQNLLRFLRPHYKCGGASQILRQVGLENVRQADSLYLLRIFFPELIVLGACCILLLRVKFQRPPKYSEESESEVPSHSQSEIDEQEEWKRFLSNQKLRSYLDHTQSVLTCVLCGFSGCILPSVLNGVYFVTFVFVATAWAFHRRSLTDRVCGHTHRWLLPYMALHLTLLYAFQFPFVHRFVIPHDTVARLFGLLQFLRFPCEPLPYPVEVFAWRWTEFAMPAVVFVSYTIIALMTVLRKEHFDVVVAKTNGSMSSPVHELRAHSLASPKGSKGKNDDDYINLESVAVEKSKSLDLRPSEEHVLRRPSLKFLMERASLDDRTVVRFLHLLRSQSYAFTLLVMMAWAMTYHSWLTFVLLIVSCAVWMYPDSQRFCLRIIPFITIYAEFLLFIQYVYGFKLTQSELPDEKPLILRQLGFEKPRDSPPFYPLLLKSLFTCAFWLTLKQRMVESSKGADQNRLFSLPLVMTAQNEGRRQSTATSSSLFKEDTRLGRFLLSLKSNVSRYWIVVNLALLLVISVQNPVVMYRIFYMLFFLLFLMCFQLSFPVWRKLQYAFWMIMLAYCMFVLTLIYTYQFHGLPNFYIEYLGMSDAVVRSFGLEQISTSQLFIRLLTPISFLIFSLIQVNFFHSKLMERSARWEEAAFHRKPHLRFVLEQLRGVHGRLGYIKSIVETDAKDVEKGISRPKTSTFKGQKKMKEVIQRLEAKCQQVFSHRQVLSNLLLRLLEIHADKIVAFAIVHVALKQVSALNLPLVVVVAIFVPLRWPAKRACNFVAIWVTVVIFCKMLYQMEFFDEDVFSVQCESTLNETLNETTIDLSEEMLVHPFHWFGMHKTDSIFHYIKDYVFLMVLLSLRTALFIRQEVYRAETNRSVPAEGILFEGVTRAHADKDVVYCAKFFANFLFYKFGLEICFIVCVIDIGYRYDVFSVIYAFWLIALYVMDRPLISRVWSYWVSYLAVNFVLQYVFCVGLPELFCLEYPWSSWDRNLVEWLFLPEFDNVLNPKKLTADFFLLLVCSCQLHVFGIEEEYGDKYAGGSNASLLGSKSLGSLVRRVNLLVDKMHATKSIYGVPDFISSSGQNLLDQLKTCVFLYAYWLTLAVVFIAGTTRVTLFALGYVVGCFAFLWIGNALFNKPIAFAVRLWDFMILYNLWAMLMKVSLQVVGCVYMSQMYKNFCWVLQLFGIACMKSRIDPSKSESSTSTLNPSAVIDSAILAECEVPTNEAGIFYDGLCFVFLVVQRRIFCSEYFKHVIAELQAQQFLASRGAEILSMITQKDVEEAERNENEFLEKIRRQMNKIRRAHTRELSTLKVIGGRGKGSPGTELDFEGSIVTSPANVDAETEGSERPPERPTDLPIPENVAADDGLSTDSNHGLVLSPAQSAMSPSSAFLSVGAEENELKRRSVDYGQLHHSKQSVERQKSMVLSKSSEGARGRKFPEETKNLNPKVETYVAADEGGVKGLGPLQLLNFAFKKGTISDALKESNEIEATHLRLKKEMEDTFGVADHEAIRRAILRQKARKAKADYDEATFDEEALTHREATETMKAHLSRKRSSRSSKGSISRSPSQAFMDRKGSSRRSSRRSSKTAEFLSLGSFIKRRRSALKETSGDVLKDIENMKHQHKKKGNTFGQIRARYLKFRLYAVEFGRNLAIFLLMLGRGVMESIISTLMRLSRDYRYIAHILQEEKKLHKKLFNQSGGHVLEPSQSLKKKRKAIIRENMINSDQLTRKFGFDEGIRQLHTYFEKKTEGEEDKTREDAGEDSSAEDEHDSEENSTQSTGSEYLFVRLVIAAYYLVLSRSELICYLMVVLNHINSASVISMPLPLMTFLWGALTVPRPSKRFWIALISYTGAMVIVKYVFQFGFFPWNRGAGSINPLWLPRIIGVEKRLNYCTWDIALLMTLFFHRSLLMTIGLWKDDSDDGDSASLKRKKFSTRERIHGPERENSEESNSFLANFKEDVKKYIKHKEIKSKMTKRFGRIRGFFVHLLTPTNRYPVDIYAPMFMCDVVCFLIVIFGYSSFGTDQGAGSVAAYFEENKVPGTLVAMLILQFVLIVFDRAIFLRKFLFGKIVLQIALVIFVHIWMFLLLPAATDRLFIANTGCKLWYFIKCIYFIISAKQIRAGYPKRSLGTIATNNYSAVNWVLYKLFMLIPFLFELRSLMDWMWMDTSLGIGDWFALQDIYSHISMLKCEQNIEEEYPTPKGVKKRPILKYGLGGVLLFIIILIIWFPLVLYSMANTVGTRSLPVECTCRLTIAGYQPLFESTNQLGGIRELTEAEYEKLQYPYRLSKTSQSYMADYDHLDVVLAQIHGDSSSRWQISPPSRLSLIDNLNSSNVISMKFEWYFKRPPDEKLQFGLVEDFRTIELGENDTIRQELIDVITGESNKSILIPHLFPPMVKVPGEGKAQYVSALLSEHLEDETAPIEGAFDDVELQLKTTDDGVEWWQIRMVDPLFDPIIKSPPVVKEGITMYGFVDKVFPKSFSVITGGGILGLYFSMVLVFGRFMRMLVTGAMQRIMFDELPNVDRVLQLCLDIFLVRDAGELELEENLFAKLVFLFRSPATLIKWTCEKTS
ncbi:hypothetical protein QR680_005168 [Steinernema hermaphroditum]|uniref:Piezo-type mechanosensitive ion channel component n=1 Tax=Steinernema hermaphroditum TaxID=289476 RepID=A0AA39HTD8_9BILA|nr:hypothetical protein QR680_005168 [Steinernema hermaphroditum]